jgi:hypothetical protein
LYTLSSSLVDNPLQLRINNISSPANQNERLKRHVYEAAPAEAVELEQMTFDIEAAIFRQLVFHFAKAAIGKIYNFATTGANQVMVMFRWSSHHIAPAPSPGMDPAHQIELAQQVKCTVDRDPPDTRVF